jgi:hypothetical protein
MCTVLLPPGVNLIALKINNNNNNNPQLPSHPHASSMPEKFISLHYSPHPSKSYFWGYIAG